MTVFISKNVVYEPLLDLLRSNDIPLINQSLIEFEVVDFSCPDPADYSVIFFSSPRAVEYFLKQCNIPTDKRIASIGRATSEALYAHHLSIDFEGKRSGQPHEVASAFTAFTEGQSVLFPQSSRSNRSMQQHLPSEQVIDLVVYKTFLQPRTFNPAPAILIFTSPSNAEAYLEKNNILETQTIIAWGQTTAAFLNKKVNRVDHTLSHSTFHELTVYLEHLIHS